MASENETVEEIVNETKFAIDYGNGVLLDLAGKQAVGILDRIEATHRREVEEMKREIAELRECLKEAMVDAVAEYKNNSCFKNVKCGEIERCKTCKVVRWRKALKGASND